MIEIKDGILEIADEDSAWELITLATQNTDFEEIKEIKEIKFNKWPFVNIDIKGKQYNSSLTAANMRGLVELQNTVYRSYALVHYNSADPRKLTNEEKKELELVFNVSKGSSGITGSLDKALQSLADGMVNVMEPHHYIIIVLGSGLLWAGSTCWRTWMQNQKDIKMAELDAETRSFASQQENERMEIFAKATKERPILSPLQENAEEMYNTVFKSVSDCDSVSVAGVDDIKGDTVRTLTRSTRTKAKEVQLNGAYKILKVDSSKIDTFKVEVHNLESGRVFTATLQDTFVVRGKNKDLLQQAEWGRKPIYLQVNARDLRGSITGATIIGVEEIEDDE